MNTPNTAVIEVKFADPPKNGKKQATIKTVDGIVYGVWPDKFGLLQPGRAYEIEFSERTFDGKTYRTIRSCKPKANTEPDTMPVGTAKPSAGDETRFVTTILAAMIAGRTMDDYTEGGLVRAATMLRAVYRRSFGGSNAN